MKAIRLVVVASMVVAGLMGCATDKGASGSGAGGYYSDTGNTGPNCVGGAANAVGSTAGSNYNSPGIPYCGQ